MLGWETRATSCCSTDNQQEVVHHDDFLFFSGICMACFYGSSFSSRDRGASWKDPVAWPELREAMLTFVAGLGPEKSLPAEAQLLAKG